MLDGMDIGDCFRAIAKAARAKGGAFFAHVWHARRRGRKPSRVFFEVR
jgi:hypothetical protein